MGLKPANHAAFYHIMRVFNFPIITHQPDQLIHSSICSGYSQNYRTSTDFSVAAKTAPKALEPIYNACC